MDWKSSTQPSYGLDQLCNQALPILVLRPDRTIPILIPAPVLVLPGAVVVPALVLAAVGPPGLASSLLRPPGPMLGLPGHPFARG